jgi:hypothetical protein
VNAPQKLEKSVLLIKLVNASKIISWNTALSAMVWTWSCFKVSPSYRGNASFVYFYFKTGRNRARFSEKVHDHFLLVHKIFDNIFCIRAQIIISLYFNIGARKDIPSDKLLTFTSLMCAHEQFNVQCFLLILTTLSAFSSELREQGRWSGRIQLMIAWLWLRSGCWVPRWCVEKCLCKNVFLYLGQRWKLPHTRRITEETQHCLFCGFKTSLYAGIRGICWEC